jgi:nitroimidazol reductase NimA-like FMN-containing flavoprotein (pyridoxamine 5'-phosphate oxidase superfamily)
MINLTTNEVIRVIKGNYTGHLGFIAQNSPHVLPITYYYDESNNSIISYSAEGNKIDAMRENNNVCLQIEEIVSNNNWQSVLVYGTFEELHGADAKQKLHQFTEGVREIIKWKEKRQTDFIGEFSSKLSSRGTSIVYRININEFTGKRKEDCTD